MSKAQRLFCRGTEDAVLPCVVQASFLNQFERVHSQIDVRAFALRRKESWWSRLGYHNGLIWLLEVCCWILIFFCTPCHVWVYVCFSLCLMITYECIIFFFKCNTYLHFLYIHILFFVNWCESVWCQGFYKGDGWDVRGSTPCKVSWFIPSLKLTVRPWK